MDLNGVCMHKRLSPLFILALLALGPASPALADSLAPVQNPLGRSSDTFLPVDQAFVLSAVRTADDQVQIRWEMPETYYLYRHAFQFEAAEGLDKGVQVELPPGLAKVDEYFGEVEVYFDQARARLTLDGVPANGELSVDITYQGCTEKGLCYAPETRRVHFAAGERVPEIETVRGPRNWSAPGMQTGADAAALPQGSLVVSGLIGLGLLLCAIGLFAWWRR
jgi:thioredoxin:protein disulfide reductase